MQDPDVFGIGGRLHAERAADVVGEHAQPLGRNPEQILGERAAQAEHALAADVQGEASARRVVLGHRRPRLHGRHHDPVVDQPDPRDVRRRGERALRRPMIAEAPIETEVRALLMQARRVRGERRLRVAHRRHRLDIRDDQLGGVLCGVRILGHHDRERLADVAHPIGREDRARRREQRAAVGILERQLAQDRAVAGAREVGRGVHREHAGQRQRRGRIDAAQPAVGMGRADHARERLARQRDVVGVAPLPPHQARVLLAMYRLADAELEVRQRDGIVHGCARPVVGVPAVAGQHRRARPKDNAGRLPCARLFRIRAWLCWQL